MRPIIIGMVFLVFFFGWHRLYAIESEHKEHHRQQYFSENHSWYQKEQLECIADNIYYEANSESKVGKIAIARVIMNRVNDPRFPNDPCSVVYDGAKYSKEKSHLQRGNCQFSWLCQGKKPPKPKHNDWLEALEIAVEVYIEKKYTEVLPRSLFFHNEGAKPNWKYRFDKKIGHHLFYSSPKRK